MTIRIGTFNLDGDLPELYALAGDVGQRFGRMFERVAPDIELDVFEAQQGEMPGALRGYDAFLIPGSPYYLEQEQPWMLALVEFIRECYSSKKKLIGVCFGHQLIAHALGGVAAKADNGWGLGRQVFHAKARLPFMRPYKESLSMYFTHRDQVIELPAEAEQVGGNDFCPNCAFAIGKHVFCVQGHPEFTPEFALGAVKALRQYYSEAQYQQALASFKEGETDGKLIAQWMLNFLLA